MQKIFSFLLVFILFSCQNKKGSREIDQLVWLVGNWETIAPQGQLYENWTQSNDTILKGSSHMVINDDTVFTESLSIEQRNDGLFRVLDFNFNDISFGNRDSGWLPKPRAISSLELRVLARWLVVFARDNAFGGQPWNTPQEYKPD